MKAILVNYKNLMELKNFMAKSQNVLNIHF